MALRKTSSSSLTWPASKRIVRWVPTFTIEGAWRSAGGPVRRRTFCARRDTGEGAFRPCVSRSSRSARNTFSSDWHGTPLVGKCFQFSQQRRGKPQREGLSRRLEIGKHGHPRLPPVDEGAGIVRFPECTFLSFRAEGWNRFTSC